MLEDIDLNVTKITYNNLNEFVEKLNNLRFTRILLIEPDAPETTTTGACVRVYYEIIYTRQRTNL